MDTPDFKWRRWKIKTQNNPMLNFRALKISSKPNKFGCTLLAKPRGHAGTTMNLQIVWNTPKNPYLNQATQRITCLIFLPKKSPNRKFKTPKNPLIIPITSNPEDPPPPRLIKLPCFKINVYFLFSPCFLLAWVSLDDYLSSYCWSNLVSDSSYFTTSKKKVLFLGKLMQWVECH